MDPPPRLRHEAAPYRGVDDLIGQLVTFIGDAFVANDPVLVLERPEVNAALRRELGDDALRVEFGDMTAVGRNPGRIIPVWRDFIHRHRGRPVRGVGEPLWPGRSEAEAAECHVHEALLNQVFADQPVWILCPYDAVALDPYHLDRMAHTHPSVAAKGVGWPDVGFDWEVDLREALAEPLPEPAGVGPPMSFGVDDLPLLRWAAEAHAAAAGLSPDRSREVALVVSELTTNSVRYGLGGGTLRSWTEGRRVVHEVYDYGRVSDASVGRALPPADEPGGRGLWLVNQLCDLVQLRSSLGGTTIRVHLGP